MNTPSNRRARALGPRVGTACAAIHEMNCAGDFQLSEEDLRSLDDRGDETVSGWVFSYRVYRSSDLTRSDMLREGLNSLNPRIREQACDIVGDAKVLSLREDLKPLFTAADPDVAQAARYNYEMLADYER